MSGFRLQGETMARCRGDSSYSSSTTTFPQGQNTADVTEYCSREFSLRRIISRVCSGLCPFFDPSISPAALLRMHPHLQALRNFQRGSS